MGRWRVVILVLIVFAGALPAYAQQEAAPAGSDQQPAPLVAAPELFSKAVDALDAQQFERAVLDFSFFILLNPTVSEAYFYRGQGYQALDNLDAALADMTSALGLKSSGPQYTSYVYFSRAQLHIQNQDTEAALADLDASIEASPSALESLLLRARIYAFQNRFEDALADYDAAIGLQPENADTYLQRGMINFQLRNLEEALNDFDRVIAIDPDNVEGLIDRALIHNSLSNYLLALADLNSAIELSPQDGGLYLLRGAVNTSADKSSDAASDYLRWISLSETQRFTARGTYTTNQAFTVEMDQGWVYDIPFEAQEGQSVSVQASRLPDSDADPLVVIVDEGGTALVADDDGGGDMDAAIQDYVIPSAGRYSLLVGHALGGATGNIAVSLDFGAAEAGD